MTQPIPSETIEYERYVDGLRLQIGTMEQIAGAREKQFRAVREERDKLRHALSTLAGAVKQDLQLFPEQPHKESALGIAEGALSNNCHGRFAPQTITIHLEGGLVQDVTGIPTGVEVRVEDRDEGDTSHPSWDAEKGCFVTVYGRES